MRLVCNKHINNTIIVLPFPPFDQATLFLTIKWIVGCVNYEKCLKAESYERHFYVNYQMGFEVRSVNASLCLGVIEYTAVFHINKMYTNYKSVDTPFAQSDSTLLNSM